MRYYAQYSESGKIFAIGTGPGGVEITEGEYIRLLAEIREKAALVDRLYSGEITLADVPADWRGEIQRRMDERIAAESWWQEHVYRSTIAANVYTPDQYAAG